MISGNFRREVTSTVLWLIDHQIDIRCIRAVPYRFDDQILVNFEQIIPVPETTDFMIGISEKSAEAKSNSASDKIRNDRRREFWTMCLKKLHHAEISLYDNINPSKDHWLSAGSGVRSCPYQMIFGQKVARVQIKFERADKAENKALFDALHARKDEIETVFGNSLNWRRLDNAKSSVVEFGRDFDGYNELLWPEIIDWLYDNLQKLHRAFDSSLSAEADRLF